MARAEVAADSIPDMEEGAVFHDLGELASHGDVHEFVG